MFEVEGELVCQVHGHNVHGEYTAGLEEDTVAARTHTQQVVALGCRGGLEQV